MLTPSDHERLLSLTAPQPKTPEEGKYLKTCIHANCYLEDNEVIWYYPVDDRGYPLKGATRYRHSIVKPVRSGAKVNPNSLSQTQPWIPQNISRAQWYINQSQDRILLPFRCKLPSKLASDKARSLKLYKSLLAISQVHEVNINELWEGIAEACHRVFPKDSAPTNEEKLKNQG